MFKFKDLYVTLAPEHSGEAKGNRVFYLKKPPKPPKTIDSTDCCDDPNPTPPPSTPCCQTQLAHSAQPLAIWVGGGNTKGIGKKVKLKDYLAANLAKPTMQLSAVQEAGSLQTVGEIEALQRKLKGAVGELEKRKAQLQKRTKAPK